MGIESSELGVAESDAVVVTGLARGVDREATMSAITAGGAAIGVLAEGIEHWRPGGLRSALDDGRLLVLSEFRPDSRWSAGQAMHRNETIIMLGQAMFVIEAGENGGTLAAGRAALAAKRPLFAIRYIDRCTGNELLIDEGAQPLEKLSDLKKALRAA